MRKITLLLLAIALAPGGCAWLDSFRSDLSSQIAQLEAEGEYGRALATLAYVEPTHPQYRQLQKQKKHIEGLARALVKETIREADALVEKGEWAQAADTYAAALARLPEDEKLIAAQQDFRARRDAYLAGIRLDLLLSRGERLLRDAPLVAEVHRVIPGDRSARVAREELTEEAHDTARALLDYGEAALQRGDFDLAERGIRLAEALDHDDELDHRILIALNQIENHQIEQNRRELARNLKTLSQLEDDFRDALRKRKLLTAKLLLEKMQSLEVKPAAFRKHRDALDTAIARRIQEALDTGRRLYSQGKIRAALKNWQSVLPLEPTHPELNTHIRRAERVLEKLDRLGRTAPDAETLDGS